jgi:hypothetical protein
MAIEGLQPMETDLEIDAAYKRWSYSCTINLRLLAAALESVRHIGPNAVRYDPMRFGPVADRAYQAYNRRAADATRRLHHEVPDANWRMADLGAVRMLDGQLGSAHGFR